MDCWAARLGGLFLTKTGPGFDRERPNSFGILAMRKSPASIGCRRWPGFCFEVIAQPSPLTRQGLETFSATDRSNLMLTALILVCSLSPVADLGACTEDNALAVMRDPEAFVSPVTCFMHGQAYLAGTAIGRDLGENEAVKVLCVRSRMAAAPSSAATGSTTTIEALSAAR